MSRPDVQAPVQPPVRRSTVQQVAAPAEPDTRRALGGLLLVFAVVNFAAVALLGAAFGWPAVLDEPASVALAAFAQNQGAIVLGFYTFTLLSILLVPISLGSTASPRAAAGCSRPP